MRKRVERTLLEFKNLLLSVCEPASRNRIYGGVENDYSARN